eukprot:scaffold10108_cov37-Phaeocystis_antarctica.AAC.2
MGGSSTIAGRPATAFVHCISHAAFASPDHGTNSLSLLVAAWSGVGDARGDPPATAGDGLGTGSIAAATRTESIAVATRDCTAAAAIVNGSISMALAPGAPGVCKRQLTRARGGA